MEYAAVFLGVDGAIVRHKDTHEVANILIGDFESMGDATEQACVQLECTHIHKGVIIKGESKGGFMVVSTQELESI